MVGPVVGTGGRVAVRPLIVRHLDGLRDYDPLWRAMRGFTDRRGPQTLDELWLLEHRPVFTLGQAALPAHLLDPGEIPVVQTDRGGQVVYHGPGQLVAYLLFDLRRAGLGVRRLVHSLEDAVIALLAQEALTGVARPDAPGVYVDGAKVAFLGLRVRNGCCYHGLALNLDMDLSPFARINPCGYPGLPVTQLLDLGVARERLTAIGDRLAGLLALALGVRLSSCGDC